MENKQQQQWLEEELAPLKKEVYSFRVNNDSEEQEVGSIEVSNTQRIQMISLLSFANSLNYFQDEVDLAEYKFGAGFVYVKGNHKRSRVSFETMCKMHNTCFMPHSHHGLVSELPEQAKGLNYPLEDMVEAIKAKLVKEVYLQSTVDKRIVVQHHIISFV